MTRLREPRSDKIEFQYLLRIEKLSQVLDVPLAGLQKELGPAVWLQRGIGPMPPQDPVLYRLYEVREVACLLYGSYRLTIWLGRIGLRAGN